MEVTITRTPGKTPKTMAMMPQISLTSMTQTNLKSLTLPINLGLAAIIGYQLATLTWQLLPRPETDLTPTALAPAAPMATGISKRKEASPAYEIAKWHLFGTKPVAGTPPPLTPVVLPETRLNLSLKGIFASSDPSGGGAIIASGNTNENFYTTGTRLPGGAILESVHQDHVVILRGQTREMLKLPKDVLATPGKKRNKAASQSTVGNPPLNNGQVAMKQIRDRMMQNPQSFSDFINITPQTERGRFIGYRIQPGRNPALIKTSGLQPGDIVTTINGIALDRPDKALSALRGLSNAQQASLTIRRNNQMRRILLDFSR